MLVQFIVENFRSFKEETTFSMVASPSREHENHLIDTFDGSILRTAVVYGGNGSGKSNLIKAVKTLRDMVLNSAEYNGDRQLNPDIYLLEPHPNPTAFEIIFFLNQAYYTYGITFNNDTIVNEWLWKRTESNDTDSTVLFDREGKNTLNELATNAIKQPEKAPAGFLDALVFGLKANQCFISVLAKNDYPEFLELVGWFKRIFIVDPRTRPYGFERQMVEDDAFLKFAQNAMTRADMGIAEFYMEERKLPEDDTKLNSIQLVKGPEIYRRGTPKIVWDTGTVYWNGTNLVELSPKFQHGTVPFGLDKESEGTQRFYSLLHIIYLFWQEQQAIPPVVLIDELDSSLHTHLCRKIVEACLAGKAGQLIFTTHDTNLLRKELFRRDEIWFTEKRPKGSTELYSLVEFLPTLHSTDDATLEDDYLKGYYGGIPFGGDPERLKRDFTQLANE
jgi:AAA15 family ATPase/GTPase